MELDLFSLQGVLVESQPPEVDLFSIQGILIEVPAGSSEIIRASTVVAQKTPATSELVTTRLLVAQASEGSIALPLGATPLDLFKRMAQKQLTKPFLWNMYTVSNPRQDLSVGEARTVVDIIPGLDAPTRGKYTVTYGRRSILALASLGLKAVNYKNLGEVIEYLRSRNLLITADDLDLTRSRLTATSILLVANPNSYLFHPSSVTFGTVPTMASELSNTNLNGFESA